MCHVTYLYNYFNFQIKDTSINFGFQCLCGLSEVLWPSMYRPAAPHEVSRINVLVKGGVEVSG